jgi:phosphoribosylpyrophosphate synthetase
VQRRPGADGCRAKSVTAYITHGVLSGGAVARVNGSALKELVITDSIQPTEAAMAPDRIRVLSIAPLVGEAIRRIADESLGRLTVITFVIARSAATKQSR